MNNTDQIGYNSHSAYKNRHEAFAGMRSAMAEEKGSKSIRISLPGQFTQAADIAGVVTPFIHRRLADQGKAPDRRDGKERPEPLLTDRPEAEVLVPIEM